MRFAKIALVALFVLALVGAPATVHAEPPRKLQRLEAADSTPSVPTGVSPVEKAPSRAEKLLEAALAQVGVPQDCTDLVQNSLAAIGLTTRRDAGGFDYGVDDVAYTFGHEVHWSEALPGDIATVGPGNGGHVWIVLDPASNVGVHGGWGDMTVVGDGGVPLSEHRVYRLPGYAT